MTSLQSDEFAIPHTILRHFDLSSSPYTQSVIDSIHKRRRQYPEGKLFLDHLLSLVELNHVQSYPPTSPAAHRRLLHSIYDNQLDRLKQDCFFYYLLRDYDAVPEINGNGGEMEVDGDGNHDVFSSKTSSKSGKRAENFARRRCLPGAWRRFIDGYWFLDHGLWEDAVAALSDPSITEINFCSQILRTISNLASPPSQACKLVYSLLTATRPILNTPEENDIKLLAMSSSANLSQAFSWIRTHGNEEERTRMREGAWCWALGAPKAPCGMGEHGVQSKALKELLHLPLLPEENTHLITFLSHPPRSISSPALSLLHDLVTLRLIHQGQYAESLQLDKDLVGSGGKEEDRQRRREMVREFIGILPEAQRRALLASSEVLSEKKDQERREVVNGEREDVDMSDSWVNIPPQPEIPPLAPVPNRVDNSLLNLAQSIALPSSPAPQVLQRHNSPFAGPPRFASTVPNSSVLQSPMRNLSGSPFKLPPNVIGSSSSKPEPKQSKKIINDDDDPVDLHRRSRAPTVDRSIRQGTVDRSTRQGTVDTEMDHEGKGSETAQPEPTPVPRRSKRVVSGPVQKDKPKDVEKTPPTSPSAGNRRSNPTRRQTATKGTENGNGPSMPGAFLPDPESDSMPPPPTPARSTRAQSQATDRSRLTDRRSVSRARDEEEDTTKLPPNKRTKATRRTSEVTDGGRSVVSNSTRRSTRRGTTVQPSERGSPTPSVGGRSEDGRTRKGKGGEVNGGLTPRVTRSKRG